MRPPELPPHTAEPPLNEGRVRVIPGELWARIRTSRLFYPANEGGALLSTTAPKITGEQLESQGIAALRLNVVDGEAPAIYDARDIQQLAEQERGELGVMLERGSGYRGWGHAKFSRGIAPGQVRDFEWTKSQS